MAVFYICAVDWLLVRLDGDALREVGKEEVKLMQFPQYECAAAWKERMTRVRYLTSDDSMTAQ